jgi:hypothetical protein
LRQGYGRLDDHQVDLAGHKILHGRTAAAIWHERKAGAGLFLKQDAGDMRSRSRDRLRRLVGVCLQPGDETLEVVGRHGFLCEDQERIARKQRDRLEILHDVVRKRESCAVRNVGVPLADVEGVAVRRRARDAADADAAAGAANILDDDGLTQRHPHALGEDAGDGIRRPARGERHDHGDWARGIGLPMRGCEAHESRERDRKKQSHA